MAYEIVVAGPDDYPAALDPAMAAFGELRRSEEQIEDWRLPYDDMYLLGAREAGRWVGTVADYEFGLTVPGGGIIAASGVTMVGVLPTHRRQGIASALMARLHDDAAQRGAAVAILLAMEAGIYPRFGYGVAAQYAHTIIDPRQAAFREPLHDPGSLELVDHEEGTKVAAEVWERHRSWRPGTIDRHDWMWELHRRDREDDRDGFSARYWVIHRDADGEADGVVGYRVKEGEQRSIARYQAIATDLVATSPDVEAILVRYLCQMDLMTEVTVGVRPVDDHLRWRLADFRQYQVTEHGDFLWLRLLDVPAAFGARTYRTADEVVVEVEDPSRPQSGGRFAIGGDPEGGRCAPTDAPADLTMDTTALASLLLGTVPASTLADAARIEGRPDVLARADLFFSASPAPFASTDF